VILKKKVSVEGFTDFIGIGRGRAKKQAQTNAALAFCDHLLRTGKLNKSDLPPNVTRLLKNICKILLYPII